MVVVEEVVGLGSAVVSQWNRSLRVLWVQMMLLSSKPIENRCTGGTLRTRHTQFEGEYRTGPRRMQAGRKASGQPGAKVWAETRCVLGGWTWMRWVQPVDGEAKSSGVHQRERSRDTTAGKE